MTKKISKSVASPCISVCLLNKEDVCTGCYRTADEITHWLLMDDSERRDILVLAQERGRRNNPFAL